MRVDRRRCIAVLGGIAAMWPLAAGAQGTQGRIFKLGLVSFHSPTLAGHIDYMRDGLRQLGWIEGRNLTIEAYFTDGDRERTRETLRALIGRGADILVAWTTPAAQIARELTQTVPVVMIASDPLAAKLIDSLARPGGNLTGVSMSGPDLAGKRLELLRQIRPRLRTVAFLGSSKSPGAAAFVREFEAAARRLDVRLLVRLIAGAETADDAFFAALKAEGVEAVVVQPVFTGLRERIVPSAMKAHLPVISDYALFAEAGALLTLGVDEAERLRRTAYYIDRILKGTHPRDLPVEQATTFQLVINVTAARKLAWTIPPAVIARADRVIQ